MTAYPLRSAREHFRTYYREDSSGHHRVSLSDWFVYVVLPLSAGVIAWRLDLRVTTVTPLLTGSAIATGFQYGLLWQIFNVGVKLKESEWAADSRPAQLAKETFVTASWATLIALALSGLLVVVGLFDISKGGTWAWVTGVIVALAAHFGLTLFQILGRFRELYDAARDVRS